MTTIKNTLLSIYLHIPFCQYRCSYCDFNTYTSLGDIKEVYADALAREIEQVLADKQSNAKTIFFGGGTPSLLSHTAFQKIFKRIRQVTSIDAKAEITIEANPETVDLAYMQGLEELGINRISFGAQSIHAHDLEVLGRQHQFDTVVKGIEATRQAGIENISIDLIYGVPGQTLANWRSSVETVLALGLPHLSFYCLTVEPGTSLHRDVHGGRIPLPDPDLAADQYDIACELMEAAGYEHYEISNWALPGHQSEHNLTYWRNGEYLGLGAGAHGHAGQYRYHVVKQPRVYMRRLQAEQAGHPYPLSAAVADFHVISPEEEMADTIMMGLRLLIDGLDLDRFERRFGVSFQERFQQELKDLLALELVEMHPSAERNALRLTPKGRFLSNQVFHRFIDA